MKKKFLALVLTLAMVLSLVPMTALATGATQEGNNQGPVEVTGSDNDKKLTMKKTVMPNKDGTYTVRLESYAKGEVTTTTTTKPMDIVLLLDVSGSMNQTFTPASSEYHAVYNDGSLDTGKRYYIQRHNWYYEVSYCNNCQKWTSGCYDWLWHVEGTEFIPRTAENDNDDTHTQFYEYVYTNGQSKLDALKTAVNQFIGDIAQNSPQSNISIVKFADSKIDNVGNDTYYGTNYTQIVQRLTKVDESGVETLKSAVSSLKASGSTASDYGLEKAQEALENAAQDKVVVLFTDGEPNHQNGFDYKVATDAVNTAKTLKQDNTTIYTVGVFKNPSNDINLYMSSVSSNYPEATAARDGRSWRVTNGGDVAGTHYINAENATDLIKAFQTISSQVSSTHLNANAVVVDNVPSNFKAPANVEDVTLKVADYKADGTFDTETAAPSTIHASVNEDGTVSVTGFDFSKNWCGPDGDKPHGQKLIIEFTISRTNYGGTQPTNAGAYIKANADSTDRIIWVEDPEVPVTVQLPDVNNPAAQTKTYDGAGFDIKDEIGKIIAGLVYVNGTNNKFIDLTYEIKDSSGKTVGTYTISAGKTTGTWSADTTEIKTSPNVGKYTYTITVTGQDQNKDKPNNRDRKTCEATFTITQKKVTFTGESKSVEWNGKEQTITGITDPTDLVTGHTYKGGLTYVAKGTDTGSYDGVFTGTAIIKDAAGTDVTANYNVKTEPGTLTITEKEEVPYTLIFNANGGAWAEDVIIPDYSINENSRDKATRENLTASDTIKSIAYPTKNGATMIGWGTQDGKPLYQLGLGSGVAVSSLKSLQGVDVQGNTITLYAIWKDVPQSAYTYTIRQHFMKDEKQELGAQNYIKLKEVQAGTEISTLIPSDTQVEFDGRMYLYEANNTTVNKQKYEGTEEITGKDTVIDLYYYLDSWKDGDIGPGDKTDDSLTGGDGIPDYKQILIQYQVYQEGNGLVTPEFEVVTVKDNKDNKELTAIHGSSVTKAGTGYTFVTWTGQNVAVTEKTVGDIIKETSAEKLKKEKCDLSKDTFEQGKSYTYTAIFLEDKLGGGDNKDQPDGIPDAWQYKVTFKVVNGNWNNNTNQDIVTYVTKKNAEGNSSTNGTAKLTTDQIPPVGNQPNSGYQSSGRWDKTPSTDLNITGDTVFTYTYDKKSGGSGGSGGSHKPTVTIPDDVPTGLNGKDHYAYVVGYPDGMVYPQKNITRAEVATIFFRLLTDETREANMTKSNSYNDMKDGAWYTCAVSTLSKMGIIKGYEDGSFKPDASISRAEFAAIAARFDPDGDKTPATFSDVSSHWAKDEISIAANHGWIKGYEDGSFKPDQKITRAETMTLVNRVLKRLPETKDDLHKDMKTWPDNQNESAWFYLAVQEATNSHYQNLKKDGTHEKWESMRETRDWAALEK